MATLSKYKGLLLIGLLLATLIVPVLAQEQISFNEQVTTFITPPLKFLFGVPKGEFADTIVFLRFAVFLLLIVLLATLSTKLPMFEGKQSAAVLVGGLVAYMSIRLLPDETLIVLLMSAAALAVFAILVMIVQSATKAAPGAAAKGQLLLYGVAMLLGAFALNSIAAGVQELFKGGQFLVGPFGPIAGLWGFMSFIIGAAGVVAAGAGLWKSAGGFYRELSIISGSTQRAERDLNAEVRLMKDQKQIDQNSDRQANLLETDFRKAAAAISQGDVNTAKAVLEHALKSIRYWLSLAKTDREKINTEMRRAEDIISDLQNKGLRAGRAEQNLTKLQEALLAQEQYVMRLDGAISRLELEEYHTIQEAMNVMISDPKKAYDLLRRAYVIVKDIEKETWAKDTTIGQELQATIQEAQKFAKQRHNQQVAAEWEGQEEQQAMNYLNEAIKLLTGAKVPTAKRALEEIEEAAKELKASAKQSTPAARFAYINNVIKQISNAKTALASLEGPNLLRQQGPVPKSEIEQFLIDAILMLQKAEQRDKQLIKD